MTLEDPTQIWELRCKTRWQKEVAEDVKPSVISVMLSGISVQDVLDRNILKLKNKWRVPEDEVKPAKRQP